MRAVRLIHGLALSVLVAACSLQVAEEDFNPSIDADQTDSPPAAIELTPNPLPVMEGESADITLRATGMLTADLAVTLTAEQAIVGLDQTSVVLSPSMPEVTLSVTAFDDADALPGATTLMAMSDLGATTAGVNVTDDDEVQIIVEPEAINVNEDATSDFRVRLAAAPAGDLTITVMSQDTSIATVSDSTLEFSASNWDVDQTVTVLGSRDPDDQIDTTPIHLTGTGVDPVDIPVTVNDIDRLAILITQGPFVVTEQQAPVMVGVRLSLPPTGNITVTAAPMSAGIQLDTTSLQFTPQNYNMNQFISITGRMDADTQGFTTMVTLTASDASVVPLTFNVQVIDDDLQAILEDAADPLVIDEGGTGSFNIHLAFQPMDDVTVAVSSLTTTAATVSPSVVTFTPTDWMNNKLITVTGVDDPNTVLNTSVIRMAAAPLQTDVNVNVTDLDQPEILLTGEPSMVTEGGTASFTVRLRYEPAGPVTVNVGSSDAMAIAVTAGATLNFNPSNYGTPQMVTLSAPMDVDVIQESATITVMATGFPQKTFTATVQEQSVINIIASTGSVTVTEQAAGVPFTVRLSNPPAGTMVVSLTANSPGIGLTATQLTFDSTNYMSPQSVTVTGLMDDDVQQLDTSITLNSAMAGMPVTVNVTVLEDDVQEILEFAPAVYQFDEGTQSSFNISLKFRPSANVIVTVTSTNTNAATVATGTVTFTTTDWNTMKPVTLNGIDDMNVANDTTTIQLRVTGQPMLVTDVAATVRDLDIQDVVLAMVPANINENGTANFTVRLAYQPSANTTVSVGSSDAASVAVTVGSSLLFTTSTWNSPQGVTLSAPNDIDLVNETATITASSGSFSEMFNITVLDMSTITIVPSVGNLLVTEEGSPQSFTVTLSNPPNGTLAVNVLPQSAGISVNTPTLNFNTANYNTPQTVSVTGLTDVNTIDLMTSVNLTATGATMGTVQVTVDDDDNQAIVESAPDTIQITDPDGTAPQGFTFGVRLAFQPQGNTIVNVASGSTAVAQVSTGSLTFSTSNWNVEQMVTVTAVADANMADGTTAVNLTSTPIPAVAIPVTVDDQDVQVVEVNMASMTITEGSSQNLGVRLRYQPAAGTSVSLSSNNGEVTVPSTVSFTTVDYNGYKNASVATMVDSDNMSETATITLGNVDAPATTTVGVTVTDNTIIEQFGWPNTFSGSGTYTITNAIGPVAHKITITTATTLDSFGITTTSSGNFKMAIYDDSVATPNQPGALRYSIDNAVTANASAQIIDATNTALPIGSYWIVMRADSVSVRQETGGTQVRRCYSTTGPFALGSAWPLNFGSVNCGNAAALNFSITAFR